MAQVDEDASDLGPFEKTGGQMATTVVGATLLFGCEVSGFSNKEEREREYESLRLPTTPNMQPLWHVWHSGGPPKDNGRDTLSLIKATAQSLATSNKEQRQPRDGRDY